MKKMIITIGIPINTVKKGMSLFISRDDFILVQEIKDDTSFGLWLYIKKNVYLHRLCDENTLPIKKIGEGLRGEDFFINFANVIYDNFYSKNEIEESNFLEPVKIDYAEDLPFSNFSNCEDGDQTSKCCEPIEKAFESLPASIADIVKNMRSSDLNELECYCKSELGLLDNDVDNNSVKTIYSLFTKDLLSALKLLKDFSEIKNVNPFKGMSQEKLDQELEEALKSQNYEKCAQISEAKSLLHN